MALQLKKEIGEDVPTKRDKQELLIIGKMIIGLFFLVTGDYPQKKDAACTGNCPSFSDAVHSAFSSAAASSSSFPITPPLPSLFPNRRNHI